MADTYKLTASETVTVLRRSPELFEVEGRWGPHGKPPPPHYHPDQDEHFEVLEGTLTMKLDGEERKLSAGDTLDIPSGTSHQMWNAGDVGARALWQTRPARRTEDWFRAVDALHAGGREPGALDFGPLLSEYDDVIRLAAAPRVVMKPATAILGALGRLRGRGQEN
jgi:mannose-6-phosphate isomerase-like protein (cupin superfamily)